MKSFIIATALSLFVILSLNSTVIVQDSWVKIFDVTRGQTVNSSISLFNPTERVVNGRLYQADFITNARGDDLYLIPNTYYRSNAEWIRFQNTFTLQPNQVFTFPFSFHVPNRNDLSGSYWSILFVEESVDMSQIYPENIIINTRSAIEIITNIIGSDNINMVFEDFHYSVNTISLTLRNIGDTYFNASVKIDIYSDKAEFIGSFVSERNRVYPNFAKRVHIPVSLFRYNSYHAIIVADAGNGNVIGHQVSFSFD